MKVWIFSQNAVPASEAGVTRHFYIARDLVERGHDVTVFASDFNHFLRKPIFEKQLKKPKVEVYDNVKFVWVPSAQYNTSILKRLAATFDFLKQASRAARVMLSEERPDVIVGSSPQLLGAYAAAQIALKEQIPFVAEIRDIWPLSAQQLGNFSNLNPMIMYFKWVEEKIYSAASKIISVLPNSDSYFSKFRAEHKVSCIPNFINVTDVPQYQPNTDSENFRFLYLGSFGIANDLETVVKAASILEHEIGRKDIRICLKGGGAKKPRILELIDQLNVSILSCENPVPKTKVHGTLQAADAFIMPLKKAQVFEYGVSPNKLFDYMLSARPTIFAIETQKDPISLSGGGVCIPSERPREMAKAFVEIADLPADVRHSMGLKAREYALEHHTLAKAAGEFENVLKSSIENQVEEPSLRHAK